MGQKKVLIFSPKNLYAKQLWSEGPEYLRRDPVTILLLIGLWLLAVASVLMIFAGASHGRYGPEPSMAEPSNTMKNQAASPTAFRSESE